MLQTVGFWICVVLWSAIIGFGFGYFVGRLVCLMHARVGSKPPLPPFLGTPLRWGLFFWRHDGGF